MKKVTHIFASIVFIFIASYAFSGPGDDLKLPRKDKKGHQKGKEAFVSLLPGSGSAGTSAAISMRDNGFALITGNTSVDLEMKNYSQQFLSKRGSEFSKFKNSPRYQRIFDMYDRILSKYGIPKELKYLSVIESALNPNCLSSAGALGPWQLMPDEAQRYNLLRGGRDLRTDFEESTVAASKLINSLYKTYGDWLLVLSAYNAGVGRVNKAIRQSGSRDFWILQKYLPNETRHHVRRIIATHYFFEGNTGFSAGTSADPEKLKRLENRKKGILASGMASLKIKGIYNAVTIARTLGISEKTFNDENPDFNITLAAGKEYDMHIPADKMQLFINNRETILQDGLNDLLQ